MQDNTSSAATPSGTATEAGNDTKKYDRAIDWDVKPPKVIRAVDPNYQGKNGAVALWLIVGANGIPQNVKVTSSLDAKSDAEAIKAVQMWKFKPATKDGHPVAVQIAVHVNFHSPRL
jgi:bla regulator protein blaR1